MLTRFLKRAAPAEPVVDAEPSPVVADHAPIFGFMRFSTLIAGKSGFRQMHDLDVEDRARLLFAPERMEIRFRFFEALALPSLIAQDSDDWQFVIFHAELMPDPYLTRLRDLIAPHDHIHAVPMKPDERLATKVRRQMNRRVADDITRWVSFRLDDDDALSSDFVTRLRAAIELAGDGQFAVTFPRGHALGVDDASRTLHLDEDGKRFGIGCGLAVHAPREKRRGAYNLGAVHRHVDNAMPTISDARAPAYIIGTHAHSDTGSGSRRVQTVMESPALSIDEVAARLGAGFAHVDLERLLRAAEPMQIFREFP